LTFDGKGLMHHPQGLFPFLFLIWQWLYFGTLFQTCYFWNSRSKIFIQLFFFRHLGIINGERKLYNYIWPSNTENQEFVWPHQIFIWMEQKRIFKKSCSMNFSLSWSHEWVLWPFSSNSSQLSNIALEIFYSIRLSLYMQSFSSSSSFIL
jgi:hypothetical protein